MSAKPADPILRCTDCAAETPWDPARVDCPACAGTLEAQVRLPSLRAGIAPLLDTARPGVWRYRPALAVPANVEPVTLGEGATPIIALPRWGVAHGLDGLLAKLEFAAPTGSFKDRGATVVMSVLRGAGVARIVEDSSGNAGAALAAYAARAGVPAAIFVPAAAPPSKVSQIERYGAALHPVAGTREEVAAAARRAAAQPGAVYASHARHPAFLEGTKTFGLELLEDFGAAPPEHLVVPVGNGGLLLGAFKAWREVQAAGLQVALPRLHAVQASACAPLVEALASGDERPRPVAARPTRAGGVAVAVPVRGAQILAAIRGSGGAAVAVGEAEIRTAHAELAATEGLYLEPTSALAFAGAARLRASGIIAAGASVLVPATGSGLKDVDA